MAGNIKKLKKNSAQNAKNDFIKNKENIPFDSGLSKYTARSKIQINKNAFDLIADTHKSEKRPPLADFNYQLTTKDCETKTKLSENAAQEISKSKMLKIAARDSYPLNLMRLKPFKKSNLCHVDEKHFTFRREYDLLKMEVSPNDTLFNFTDNSFYNESQSDLKVCPHSLQSQEIKSTPLQECNAPETIDIKEVRKQHFKEIKRQSKTPEILPLLLDNQIQSYNEYIQHSKVQGTVNLDSEEPSLHYNLLYSPMYLQSVVRHLLKKEMKNTIIPKSGFLPDMNRSIVINWIIKLQTSMKTDHNTLHTAVRLFDKTYHSMNIPLQLLQLVALAAFWISSKYYAAGEKAVINAKLLVKLTAGAYTADELSDMEVMIFKNTDYDINAVDITTFVHYYILLLNTATADIISECSHYLLTCSYLNDVFLLLQPSYMAAGAVFTSLHLMNQFNEKLWAKLCGESGYYSPRDLLMIKRNLISILKQVNDPSFPCREPFIKYSSTKHHKVALLLNHIK